MYRKLLLIRIIYIIFCDLHFESSNLHSYFLIYVPSCFITLKYDLETIFLLQILYSNSYYSLQQIRDHTIYKSLQQIRDTRATDV